VQELVRGQYQVMGKIMQKRSLFQLWRVQYHNALQRRRRLQILVRRQHQKLEKIVQQEEL